MPAVTPHSELLTQSTDRTRHVGRDRARGWMRDQLQLALEERRAQGWHQGSRLPSIAPRLGKTSLLVELRECLVEL